jgi:hypothetical protein
MPPASRLQTKVEPTSLPVKVKFAEALLLEAAGADVIVVSGATVSTVQEYPVVPV